MAKAMGPIAMLLIVAPLMLSVAPASGVAVNPPKLCSDTSMVLPINRNCNSAAGYVFDLDRLVDTCTDCAGTINCSNGILNCQECCVPSACSNPNLLVGGSLPTCNDGYSFNPTAPFLTLSACDGSTCPSGRGNYEECCQPTTCQTAATAFDGTPTCNAGYVFDINNNAAAASCTGATCPTIINNAPNTMFYAQCCVPQSYTCGEDLLAKDTECTQGFYFKPTGKYTTDNQATCAITSYLNGGLAPTGCVKAGVAQCCYQRTCEQTDAVGNTFCPYGYQLKKTSYCTTNDQGVRTCEGPSDINPANSNINTALTVNTCCERIVQVARTAAGDAANDATNAAFPRCNSVNSGGALTGVQASTQDDTNWRLQDENSFLRTVDIYQGMCFSVTIDNDCTVAESLIKPTCCTRKVPTYVQFKIPTETGVTEDDGDQINNVRANTMRLDNLRKCALRYGRHITPARALKPINNWLTVPPVGANTGDARFINIPITFGRGARQATVCIYTNNFKSTEGNVDCTWESLCGYGAGGSVPTEAGNYMKGCEMRLVGRNSPTSTPCCSPVYSIESVDFFPAGANATVAKPFKVITKK